MTKDANFTRWSLYKGMSWTVVTYGLAQFVRLVAVIILTRLLTPELFGIMAIVNSVRTGIDLISDVGFGQSLVQNKNAERPEFYTTAWTLKLLRGLALWVVCAIVAWPVAHFYNSPILVWVLPVAALYFVFEGFSSISPSLMQRRLRVRDLGVLSLVYEFIQDAALVVLAYFYRSIWPLVLGLVIGSAAKMVISFFLLPDVRLKFFISKQYARQILQFGRWIAVSSAIYFLSMNFDRLYLAKAAPLAMLGIYGIARGISDMMASLVSPHVRADCLSLCCLVVAHLAGSAAQEARPDTAETAVADRARPVRFCSGRRRAGQDRLRRRAITPRPACCPSRPWAFGSRRSAASTSRCFWALASRNILRWATDFKFAWLLAGLPLSYAWHGFYGVILVVAASDIFRYLPILFGQIRTRFSFAWQDLLGTVFMFALFGLFVWIRWVCGFGVALHNPIE